MTPTNYWRDALAQRVSRRRTLALTGGAAVASFLAACGGNDKPESKSPEAQGNRLVATRDNSTKQAKRGGVIKGSLGGEPSTLDPMSFDTPLMNPIKNSVYSMLLRDKPGTIDEPQQYKELVPNIAESWEMSPDRLTITMKIRQGVKFHNRAPFNGRTMDVEDLVFSWKRYAAIGNYRATLSNATNPNAPIVSFTAVDSRTLQIKLAQPVANALNLLAHPYHGRYVVMGREADGGYDPRGDMIGTGPYVLSKYAPSQGMEFKRHPEYWDKERPIADEVSAPFISDYAQRLAQFKAGAIYTGGAGTTALRPEDTVALKKEVPALDVYTHEALNLHTSAERFGYLPAGTSPFRDERVRQAFSMAIDRNLYLDTFNGGKVFPDAGIPINHYWASSVIPGGFWWLDPKSKDFGPNAKYYEYNVTEAKKLLAAAGHTNGLEVPAHRVKGLEYAQVYHTQSDVIEQMVNDAGIRSKPDPEDFTTVYVPKWLQGNGKYDGYVHTRAPATGNDVVSIISDMYWSKGGVFFLGFDKNGRGDASGDPDIDALITKLRVEFDADKQKSLAQEIQRSLAKSMYGVMLPGSSTAVLMAWPALRNFVSETWVWGYSGSDYFDIYNWWVDESKPPFTKS